MSYYDVNKVPIWNTVADINQANNVVYPAVKNAHFHEPLSCLIAAITAMHGKYINTNSR